MSPPNGAVCSRHYTLDGEIVVCSAPTVSKITLLIPYKTVSTCVSMPVAVHKSSSMTDHPQVHGQSAPAGPYPSAPADLPGHNLRVYTEWSQWSSCSRCDRVSRPGAGQSAGSIYGGTKRPHGISRDQAEPVDYRVSWSQLGSARIRRVGGDQPGQPGSVEVSQGQLGSDISEEIRRVSWDQTGSAMPVGMARAAAVAA